ncbi:MAG TPA: alcohol dehydrogenase catalytic domain-containing protein [Euzebyales bacterium]|nr:alcohol dehydrogenase catalytic domain-containing protein [Euzebyales bacterium]
MRAVRIGAPGTAELVDAPAPRTEGDDVTVRVRWAAVCATDRKLVRRGVAQPRIPGHEFAGERADGTVVAVNPDIGCGTCWRCGNGWFNRCARRRSIGIDRDGGFAERVAVPPGQVVPLGGLPVHQGPLIEPLACCVHAIGMLPIGQLRTVAVVGAGAMGILAMWTLQAYGLQVVVAQRSAARRHLAAELGADVVVAPDDEVGPSLDAVVVTAPGAEPLRWALERVEVGGTVHAFAGTPGGAQVDANAVHYRHLTLLGSTGSTVADMRGAIVLARSGGVDLDRLPRTTVALADLPAVLTGEPDGRHLRTLVDIGGSAS